MTKLHFLEILIFFRGLGQRELEYIQLKEHITSVTYQWFNFLVRQWMNSKQDRAMNKGVKIGEKNYNYLQKCCEKCHEVAPLTNAGHHYNGKCICFKVTGKYFSMKILFPLHYERKPGEGIFNGIATFLSNPQLNPLTLLLLVWVIVCPKHLLLFSSFCSCWTFP